MGSHRVCAPIGVERARRITLLADGEISEDAFRLFLGEHYYTTAVGGDTEHRIAVETYAGSNRIDGEIENRLEVVRVIERGGHFTVEDNSDIDWETYLCDGCRLS